jgi:hypothetical protein
MDRLVPLDTLLAGHGLLLALASAGIAPRALAVNGQTPPVPFAPIAADVLESLDVLLNLPPQRALDDVRAIDDGGDLADLLIGQLLGALAAVDARLAQARAMLRREGPIPGAA